MELCLAGNVVKRQKKKPKKIRKLPEIWQKMAKKKAEKQRDEAPFFFRPHRVFRTKNGQIGTNSRRN
jgi:hypothetical protein